MEMNSSLRDQRLGVIMDWLRGRAANIDDVYELFEEARHDPDLRADIEWALRLHQGASDLPLVDPPPLLRQKLRQQFRSWTSAREPSGVSVSEYAAELVFDSRQDRLVAGMRGSDTEDGPVHLVWRTEVADFMVQARRLDDGLIDLDGQVLLACPTSAPVFEVTVHGPGVAFRSVDGDALGRFHTRVTDSVDRLVLTNGELTLSAPINLADG